jgi:RND family efflux transporter MFP subunit
VPTESLLTDKPATASGLIGLMGTGEGAGASDRLAAPVPAGGGAPGAPGAPHWQPAVLQAPSQAEIDTLVRDLSAQASVADSVRHLCGWLGEHTGAAQLALGWWSRGHVRLATDPGGATASANGPGPAGNEHDWCAAMEEALDQGQTLYWPPVPGEIAPWVTRAQGALAPDARHAVLSLILPGSPEPLGALTLLWPPGMPVPRARDLPAWQALATGVAPVLGWQCLAERPWHRQLRQTAVQSWRRLTPRLRRHPGLAGGALAAVLLALGALPMPAQVGGQARIEGAQQRVLVASSDGFIQHVHAQPGDHVKAGQVLADLAEQDLKLERDKWASQIAQQDNSYAAAMTRADRAEAALALSRLEEAQAQLALVDEQLQRTQLKAPFDGVLIQGDLSQSIGAPVKQGDTLMTVASTQRWRVIVEVDEADIARVRPGQAGQMALSALPWDTLPLRVRRITPLAQAKDGRNLFEVEADFTAAVPAEVRPGLMGQAKLRVGSQPLLWTWLRPVADKLRLGLWSWWG